MDIAAGLFARACAVGGLHIFGRREYYSNFEQRIAARMPSYRSAPPARRIIADVHGHSTTDLQTIFAELAIT